MNILRLSVFITGLILSSCSPAYQSFKTLSPSQHYTTGFPIDERGDELKSILKSIKRLSTVSTYTAYHFNMDQNINLESVPFLNLESEAVSTTYFNESASGTATILLYDFSRILVLTCAHVGDYPDTLITYFHEGDKRISSLAVKSRTDFFIQGIPDGDQLIELARDRKKDLALFGKRYASPRNVELIRLNIPLGKNRDLQWGSFVYLLGFPMGVKMVSRGIVSPLESSQKNQFLIDASFNRGFSGGLVLGYRQETGYLEWVGLAKSVSADSYYRLTPGKEKIKYTDKHRPYEDEIYLERAVDINYGVTYAVSPNAIRAFLKKNHSYLIEEGYDLSPWLE